MVNWYLFLLGLFSLSFGLFLIFSKQVFKTKADVLNKQKKVKKMTKKPIIKTKKKKLDKVIDISNVQTTSHNFDISSAFEKFKQKDKD